MERLQYVKLVQFALGYVQQLHKYSVVTAPCSPQSSPMWWLATAALCVRWNSTMTPTVSRSTVSLLTFSSSRTMPCPASWSQSLDGYDFVALSSPSLNYLYGLMLHKSLLNCHVVSNGLLYIAHIYLLKKCEVQLRNGTEKKNTLKNVIFGSTPTVLSRSWLF